MADLGIDIGGVLDIDGNLSLVEGRLGLAQSISRRLSTPRGGLFYDLEYGFDLRVFLNTPVRPDEVRRGVENECLKDERVDDARAEVAFNEAASTLTVRITITDGDGPFVFTISVSAVTTELLFEAA